MSILNRASDGLLSVLVALRRGLLAYGNQSEAELLELVAPTSVVSGGNPEMAKRTLTRWKQLGFFDETGGVIALGPTIAPIGADDLNALRAGILRLILAPANNSMLVEDGTAEPERSRASDCTRAIAWALAQDPYTFPAVYKNGVEQLQREQGIEPSVFANDTRWQGFAEWAVFLGVGWKATRLNFIPAPIFAVRAVLNEVFLDSNEVSQVDFFNRIGTALPVVDGGVYRTIVEGQITRPRRTSVVNEVSASLSAALLTLEAEGTLRMEMRSDAPARLLLGSLGSEPRPVSHILRQGRA